MDKLEIGKFAKAGARMKLAAGPQTPQVPGSAEPPSTGFLGRTTQSALQGRQQYLQQGRSIQDIIRQQRTPEEAAQVLQSRPTTEWTGQFAYQPGETPQTHAQRLLSWGYQQPKADWSLWSPSTWLNPLKQELRGELESGVQEQLQGLQAGAVSADEALAQRGITPEKIKEYQETYEKYKGIADDPRKYFEDNPKAQAWVDAKIEEARKKSMGELGIGNIGDMIKQYLPQILPMLLMSGGLMGMMGGGGGDDGYGGEGEYGPQYPPQMYPPQMYGQQPYYPRSSYWG